MSWDNSAIHQDLTATGRYSSSSDLAKEYAGLKEDGGSRVDDGEGWREIKRDRPPKNAAEYEALVKQYASQGFDVKAIDMDGDDFTNSNIAIKPKGASSGNTEINRQEIEMSPEYAHAKARVSQFQEDILSGRSADEVFGDGSSDSQSFLDRYKLKLGERLANGNYRPPKLKNLTDDKSNPVE